MEKKTLTILFFLYLLLAVVFTWPLTVKMSSSTYGYAGDNFGAIHYFWQWKQGKLLGFDHRDSRLEEAPFGVRIDHESQAFLYYFPLKVLTLLTNEVFAYNLILLLSFPAAALAMYFLAYFLTKNPYAGFLSGLIFSFSPYHFWKAYNHLDLALIWPLPLYVWGLLRILTDVKADFRRGAMMRDAVLLGLSSAAVVLTNLYYGYFMLLFTVVFLLSAAGFQLLSRGFLLPRRSDPPTGRVGPSKEDSWLYRFIALWLGFAFSLLLVLPFGYETLRDAFDPAHGGQSLFRRESYQRPLENLISLSARPWDYLIPSQDHPLWGKYVPALYAWIKNKSADFKTISAVPHERTVFLGYFSLFWMGMGGWWLVRSDEFRRRFGKLIVVIGLTVFVLFLISLPPFVIIKNRQVNLPSFYLYPFFPMFRAYARLGVMVLLGAALLASFPLSHFLNYKNRQPKAVVFVAGLLVVLVLLEFTNVPPAKVVDFSVTPSAYAWLKRQAGEKIILEWPPSFNVAEGFLWQREHQKGLANWSSPSPYYQMWSFLPDIYVPTVSRKLAGLGVDYVLVHKQLLFPQPNPVDDLWYTRVVKDPERYKTAPAGMFLVWESPDINVFAVDKDNPAKILTMTNRGKKPDVRLLGESHWPWFGGDNHFYLYNLLEEKKEVKVSLNYSLTAEDQRKLKNISFNGQARPLMGDNSVLFLKPGENDLWFRLDREYSPQEPINFQNLSLLIDL